MEGGAEGVIAQDDPPLAVATQIQQPEVEMVAAALAMGLRPRGARPTLLAQGSMASRRPNTHSVDFSRDDGAGGQFFLVFSKYLRADLSLLQGRHIDQPYDT